MSALAIPGAAGVPVALRAGLLALSALLLNLPAGAWRVRSRRGSLSWVAAIHAPIPFAFLLRRLLGLSLWFVALTLVFAVAGQVAGGRLWPPRPRAS
ncbi:hypothetical protein FJ251_16365 [bacterium]|nr:hypothetical protein [bacterium]